MKAQAKTHRLALALCFGVFCVSCGSKNVPQQCLDIESKGKQDGVEVVKPKKHIEYHGEKTELTQEDLSLIHI